MRTLILALMFIPAGLVAAEPDAELPALLDANQAKQQNVDEVFGVDRSSVRDDQWHADVEEALRFLFLRQNDVIERLEKLEAAQIKVQTPTGQVQRTVPVKAGTGYFSLASGETLVGYEDPLTGRWVNVANQQPTVVQNYQQQPVQVYSSPAVQVRTYQQPTQRTTRGRVRIWNRSSGFGSGACAGGACSL